MASQDSRDSDWNELDIGAESVATMVVSRAAKKTPTQTEPRINKICFVLGSSAMRVSCEPSC